MSVDKKYKMAENPKKDDKTELKRIHVFLFKTGQIKLKPKDPDNPEARWVRKEEVADLLAHPEDKKFFNSIMTKL